MEFLASLNLHVRRREARHAAMCGLLGGLSKLRLQPRSRGASVQTCAYTADELLRDAFTPSVFGSQASQQTPPLINQKTTIGSGASAISCDCAMVIVRPKGHGTETKSLPSNVSASWLATCDPIPRSEDGDGLTSKS